MADDGDLNDDGGVVPGLLEWAVSSASEQEPLLIARRDVSLQLASSLDRPVAF